MQTEMNLTEGLTYSRRGRECAGWYIDTSHLLKLELVGGER